MLNLVTIVNIINGCSGHFNDQEKNYSDLVGIRRIVHGCKDLYNCGDPQGKGLQ